MEGEASGQTSVLQEEAAGSSVCDGTHVIIRVDVSEDPFLAVKRGADG